MKILRKFAAISILVTIFISLVACTKNNNSSSSPPVAPPSAPQQGGINPTAPIKSYDFNPLTGLDIPQGYTVGQRPVAIMVNNSPMALPQRGVGSADVIYEMVTEGGVTRLLALFADYKTVPQTGPVRSARDQHLQLALPLNSIFVHIGSSIYAANLINEYKYANIDGMYLGSLSFAFDTARSIAGKGNAHCWYTDAAMIMAGMEKQTIAPTGAYESLFAFKDKQEAARIPLEGDAPHIKWAFSAGSNVELVYDSATALYMKTAYDQPHIDELTGAQLGFTNAMLLFTSVTLKPDGLCTEFDLTQGSGFYITGGKYESITWKKGAPDAQLRLYSNDGQEIAVNPGKSYIGVVATSQAETLLMNAALPVEPIVEPVA